MTNWCSYFLLIFVASTSSAEVSQSQPITNLLDIIISNFMIKGFVIIMKLILMTTTVLK